MSPLTITWEAWPHFKFLSSLQTQKLLPSLQVGGYVVKNLPPKQEAWVWSLGWEDPLEKEMATHSSILPWRIPWTEEPSGLQSMGSQKSQT